MAQYKAELGREDRDFTLPIEGSFWKNILKSLDKRDRLGLSGQERAFLLCFAFDRIEMLCLGASQNY